MEHKYSHYENKNIPYAKVDRRVFNSLYDAETYCTENGLDVDRDIEYRENIDFQNSVVLIAKYQKAILRECLKRLAKHSAELRETADRQSSALADCHPLDHDFLKDQLNQTIAKHTATYEAQEIVFKLLEELERITGYHD